MADVAELRALGKDEKVSRLRELGEQDSAKVSRLRELGEQDSAKVSRLRELGEQDSAPERFGKQFVSGVSDIALGTAEVAEKISPPLQAVNAIIRAASGDPEASVSSVTGIPSARSMREGVSEWAGEPDSLAGRAGRLSGLAAGLAAPMGGGAALVPRAAKGAGKARGWLQNLVSEMGRGYAKAPVRRTAAEAGLGVTAGVGGYAVEQQFPDSDAARLIGELAGGLAPGAAVGAVKRAAPQAGKGALWLGERLPAARLAIKGARKVGQKVSDAARRARENTTMGAGTGRAISRLERATDDRTGALARMEDEILPGARLSPAAKTEEPGLLSLEASVLKESDQLTRQASQDIAETNRVIRESLKGKGRPEATKEAFEAAQIHLRNLLDTRLKVAARQADEKIAKLGPKADPEAANRIASEELQKALQAARAQERELYAAVPKDAPTPTASTVEAYVRSIEDLGQAQLSDVPAIAKRLLNPESKQYLGSTTTIKELRGLQSKLRESARVARSNKQFNKARISDDLADAITDDIANADAGSEAVETAVAFSRDLNQRFSRGTAGKLLGTTKQGGRAVPEGLSLETTLGGGARAREAYDDLIRALDNPQVGTDPAVLTAAAEDFVKNRFLKSRAVQDGQIKTDNARRFLEQNEPLLSRMPQLRRQIQEAIDAGDLVSLRQAQAGRPQFTPKQSKATLYIQKGPDQAFDEVFRSRQPAREIQKLINQTKRDQTGEAFEGLKSSFSDYLLDRAQIGATDAADQPFVSGQRLSELLDDRNVEIAVKRLFGEEERKRLQTIARTARKLDKVRKATPAAEGVLGDELGSTTETLARILGAASGRKLGRQMGTGGTVQIPGEMSKRFKGLLDSGVINPARRLLIDAVQDEPLFKDVLRARVVDGKLPKEATRRLNAWATGVLIEEGKYDPDETEREISELMR